MEFNESALQILDTINPVFANKYVLIDQCKDYVSTVTRNNYILMGCCALAIIVMFIIIYKNQKGDLNGGRNPTQNTHSWPGTCPYWHIHGIQDNEQHNPEGQSGNGLQSGGGHDLRAVSGGSPDNHNDTERT